MPTPLGLDLASKRQRKPSDYPYHESYRTRWSDNDIFGHLNNPIYAVLIDSIINSYLSTHTPYNPFPTSPSNTNSSPTNIPPPTAPYPLTALVASTYCDYFAPSSYPGLLDVGLRVVKLGRASVMYEVGVWQEGREGVRAVGGFVQVWVGRVSGRVEGEGVPGDVRAGLAGLMEGGSKL